MHVQSTNYRKTIRASKARLLPPRDRFWQTSVLAIRPFVMADLLWTRTLSAADRHRLGGDVAEAYKAHGTAGMWMTLRGVSRFRATVEVAVALSVLDDKIGRWLLLEGGEATGDAMADMDCAIAAGMLVLAEEPRRVYWGTCPIELDWVKHSALWEFMVALAQGAKRAGPSTGLLAASSSPPITCRKPSLG